MQRAHFRYFRQRKNRNGSLHITCLRCLSTVVQSVAVAHAAAAEERHVCTGAPDCHTEEQPAPGHRQLRVPFLPRPSRAFLRDLRLLAIALIMVTIAGLAARRIVSAQGPTPLHTGGSYILDANSREFRIAGSNWYGFETTAEVVHGLTAQDYKTILNTIKSNGYNTVRLPFSNQMVESPIVPASISYSNASGAINTDLQGLNSLQIMDKIVSYAGTIGLRIILDNHRSEAGDSAESNGLWYTGSYPESAWINDWKSLATRYAGNATVIGMDLRNEPHNSTSGGSCWDCGSAGNDWHLAAERAGNAILGVNPDLLIFVEGTDAYNNDYYWWGGNLEGVKNSPVTLNVSNRLVYSAHDYGPTEYGQPWFNGSTTPASLASVWTSHWAYISQNGTAPVWLGEFGTTNNSADIQSSTPGSEGQWFQSLVQFLQSNSHLSWTYWALNGEDRYGLLDSNYDPTPANSLKQQQLATIQSAGTSGSGGGTAPAAPAALAAKATSSSRISLSWARSSTAGVSYSVYGSRTSGFAPASANLLASGITGTAYQATGLAPSTTYYYVVEAVASGVFSAPSNQATATTSAASGSGGACHIAYTDQNDWGTGFTGAVSITNTASTAINGWTLTWRWAGNQQLNQSWNANYTQNGAAVTLASMSYNGAIAAGTTLSGIGFNATYTGANSAPTAFYLNGNLCN